jgi:hypothetical protein
MQVAPPPDPAHWFGLWSLIGSVLGAAAGFVFWLDTQAVW